MADKDDVVPQVVFAATYPDEVGARADYERLVERSKSAALQHAHAALLVRQGDDLRIEQHSFDTSDTAGLGAVIGIVAGAALAVAFPPLGLAVAAAALAGGVGGGLLGGAVGAAVGHLEGEVDRDELDRVGKVLRGGQAALVVAIDAPFGDDLRALLVGAGNVVSVDVSGDSLDEAYDAVSRVLNAPEVAAAHALAAAPPDVALLLRYAELSHRADELTDSQTEHLHEIARELAAALAQHAPSHSEQAAIDKATRVLGALVASASADPALSNIAARFEEADDFARRYYEAAAQGSRPPAPRLADLRRVREYADDTLRQRGTQATLDRAGASPSNKGAVTHGLHAVTAVAMRLDDDVQAAIARTRDVLAK